MLGTNSLCLQVIDIVEVDFGMNSNPLCGSNQFVEEWPLPHDNRGTVVDLAPETFVQRAAELPRPTSPPALASKPIMH